MSKPKSIASEAQHNSLFGKAVHEMPAYRQTSCFDTITEHDHAAHKLSEIAGVLWLTKDMSEDQKNLRIARALELYESIAPQDAVEAMLALQMVAAHFAALQCVTEAMLPGRFLVGVDKFIGHSSKLMALYTRQMEALNKHRGKVQQKVMVGDANLLPRRQAVVGSVDAREPRGAKPEEQKRAVVPATTSPALSLVPDAKSMTQKRPAPKPRARRA